MSPKLPPEVQASMVDMQFDALAFIRSKLKSTFESAGMTLPEGVEPTDEQLRDFAVTYTAGVLGWRVSVSEYQPAFDVMQVLVPGAKEVLVSAAEKGLVSK